jgi:thioredoxin-related protein
MKHFLYLIIFLANWHISAAQEPISGVTFYNEKNEKIELNEKSIIIVCTQLNCRGCFDFLKTLKQKTHNDVTWYCLFDYRQLPISQRTAAIGNIESFISIPGLKYVFLEDNSPKNFRDSVQLCQSDHTPHLILSRENKPMKALPHEHLFSESADKKEIIQTIKNYFK